MLDICLTATYYQLCYYVRVKRGESKILDKKRFLSIGRLSKLTGVHIQSLRYYEELGIMRPAFVDSQSGYRYYTFSHMKIVEAIQYCAELDIPLKQFRSFISESGGEIDYARLIEYGMRIADEKMRRIRERLDFLESVRHELSHADECRARKFTKARFEEKLCWAAPYDGAQTGADFHAALYRMIADMDAHGLRAGYNNGQLLLCSAGGMRSYIFIDIRETETPAEDFPQIYRIPAGEYMCRVSEESGITKAPQAFPELFAQDYDKTVVEVELFAEKYSYSAPLFEMRCLMPER